MTELLRATGVGKEYARGLPVLSDVDLVLNAGEVHALVGENGAGKSTLSGLFAGLIRPSFGTLALDGRPYSPSSRREAEEAGVCIVTQELNLVGTMTVAESLTFDAMPNRFGVIDRRRQRELATAALSRLGLSSLDVTLPIASLGIARQQMVEIALGLSRRCRVLILDEPTAALSPSESSALFDRIRELRDQGVAIVYVSHLLEEVLSLSDRISVLRDGRLVGSFSRGEVDKDGLVRAMVGRDVSSSVRTSVSLGEVALDVRDVRGASFQVRKGEVVGLAGLVGAGRTELLRAIFGADKASGAVIVGGVPLGGFPHRGTEWTGSGGADEPRMRRSRKPQQHEEHNDNAPSAGGAQARYILRLRDRFSPTKARRNPVMAVRAGVGMLTEDRKGQGLLLPLAVRVNASLVNLKPFSRFGVVDRSRETSAANDAKQELGIRCRDEEQTVGELSGGNQQKVVLAKWLARRCDVLLFDEPTRGIDVGAKFEIYTLIDRLAQEGKAVVVASSELNELMSLCDRILVMSNGRITDELSRSEFDSDRIMRSALSGAI